MTDARSLFTLIMLIIFIIIVGFICYICSYYFNRINTAFTEPIPKSQSSGLSITTGLLGLLAIITVILTVYLTSNEISKINEYELYISNTKTIEKNDLLNNRTKELITKVENLINLNIKNKNKISKLDKEIKSKTKILKSKDVELFHKTNAMELLNNDINIQLNKKEQELKNNLLLKQNIGENMNDGFEFINSDIVENYQY